MKKVLVLFGGVSSEHDISLISANSVIKNIPQDKYEVIALGITKDGSWFKYTGDVENLPEGKWLQDKKNCIPAFVCLDSKTHGIICFDETGMKEEYVDVAFPVMHGKNGEDGTIQGLLQIAQIPFVGSNSVSSGICMDKALTNAMIDFAGIPQAKWLQATKFDYQKNQNSFLEEAEKTLGYPIFVKPANAGSSVGISKAKDISSLKDAVEKAFEHDKKIVLEEGIDGTEVECAVMGNDELFASVVGEIVPCNEFYDFDAKYISGTSQLHIPARLSDEKLEEIKDLACKVYKVLCCSGLARVDFFVRHSDGLVMLNEPNTIPGFTSISMYPKMMAASGISYSELLDKLLKLAIENG